MTRTRLFAFSSLAWMLLLPSCSSPDDTKTDDPKPIVCLKAGSQLDCTARAEVRTEPTDSVVQPNQAFVVELGGVAIGESQVLRFRVLNTASALAAAALQIESVALLYEPVNPETEPSGVRAFECLNGDLSTSCVKMKGAWKPIVPASLADPAVGLVDAQTIAIRYTRLDLMDRTAKVRIAFSGDRTRTEFVLRFSTRQGAPKGHVSPPQVVWPFLPIDAPEAQKWQAFQVINSGDADLRVFSLDLQGADVFAVEVPGADGQPVLVQSGAKAVFSPDAEPGLYAPEFVIPTGQSRELRVRFSPVDDLARSGWVRLLVNDPTAPLVPKKDEQDVPVDRYLQVDLLGNSNTPCILLEPMPKLSMGAVLLGQSASKQARIRSCGGQDLVVSSIQLNGKGNSKEFTIDWASTVAAFPGLPATGPSVDHPLVLTQQGEAKVTVRYDPADLTPLDAEGQPKLADTDVLEVKSNAFAVKTLPVEGWGVQALPPVAVVSVAEGEEVVPQTELHLFGDQSHAVGGGAIADYQWKVNQPQGSNKSLQPNTKQPNPTFRPDMVGEYEFCLNVRDDIGTQSLQPACVTVLVVPNNSIHTELVWTTPSDPDLSDGNGADVDLHFAHPDGGVTDRDCDGTLDPWFSNPFDVFWFNTNPNWANLLPNVDDDPLLALDDTDGAGPENLNLDQPEGDAANPIAYSVGVHYWNDHGFGASAATVRIYLMGVLTYESDPTELKPLDMWYVGKIHWPNQLLGTTLPPVTECRQSGDACLAKSAPGNPKGGKMWQPAGDPCITACYENQGIASPGNQAATCKGKP